MGRKSSIYFSKSANQYLTTINKKRYYLGKNIKLAQQKFNQLINSNTTQNIDIQNTDIEISHIPTLKFSYKKGYFASINHQEYYLGFDPKKAQQKLIEKQIEISKKDSLLKNGKYLSISQYQQFQKSALKRNLIFLISIEDIEQQLIFQNFKCALSGINISFNKRIDKGNASVDRIDPNLGYIKDNIQIIDKNINKLKGTFNQKQLIKYCKLISRYQRFKKSTSI